MTIRALDVFWIFDGTVTPAKPKMVVTVSPENGFFFRINSKPWHPCIEILAAEHPFLTHDSFIECRDILELDEYIVEQALKHRPVIGQISKAIVPKMRQYLLRLPTMSIAQKREICAALDVC